jgi:YD repeat-containing protein
MIVYMRRWTQLSDKKVTSLICGILFIFLLGNFALADTSTTSPEVSNFNVINSNTDPTYKGDMGLGIPLFSVPGRGGLNFPLALSYQAGIQTHQEASQVGLGWSLGTGSIVRGSNYYLDEKSHQGEMGKSIATYGCVESNGYVNECAPLMGVCTTGNLEPCLGGCFEGQIAGCAVESKGCVDIDGLVHACRKADGTCAGTGYGEIPCTGSCQVDVVDGCTLGPTRELSVKGSLFSFVETGVPGNDQEGGNTDNWLFNLPSGAIQMMVDPATGEFLPTAYDPVIVDYDYNGVDTITKFSVVDKAGSEYIFGKDTTTRGQTATEAASWNTVMVENTAYTYTAEEIANLEPNQVYSSGYGHYASDYTNAHSYNYYFTGNNHEYACNQAWICPYEYTNTGSQKELLCGDSITHRLDDANIQNSEYPYGVPCQMRAGYHPTEAPCPSSDYSGASYQIRKYRAKNLNGVPLPGGLEGIDLVATDSGGCSAIYGIGGVGSYGDIAQFAAYKQIDIIDDHEDVWYLNEIHSADYDDHDGDGQASEGDYGNWVKLNYAKYNSEYVDESPIYMAREIAQYPADPTDYYPGNWFGYDVDVQVGGNSHGVTNTFVNSGEGISEKIMGGTKAYRKATKDLVHPVSVVTSTHRADFVYSGGADEVQQLDRIDLFYTLGASDQKLMDYVFNYELDSSINQLKDPSGSIGEGERTLNSVQKRSYDYNINVFESYDPPVEFIYDSSCNPVFDSDLYDDKGLYREYTDVWGFYTGDMDANDKYIVDDMSDGCGANAWSLTSVNYPTGGSVTYSYEPNRYDYAPNPDADEESWLTGLNTIGGGVRTAVITVNDGDETISTAYTYGSGVATRIPSETYDYAGQEWDYGFPWDYPGAGSGVYIAYQTVTVTPNGNYGWVTTTFKDPYSDPLVRDEDWSDCAGHDINGDCVSGYLTSNSWRRNYPTETVSYDEGGIPVSSSSTLRGTGTVMHTWPRTNDFINPRTGVSPSSDSDPETEVVNYEIESVIPPRPQIAYVTVDGITSTTEYGYHPVNGLVNQVVENNPPYGTKITVTDFAFEDDVNDPSGDMEAKNMLVQVNSVKEYDGFISSSNLVTREDVIWSNSEGDWYPWKTYSGKYGSAERIKTAEFVDYDEYGNVIHSKDALETDAYFIYGSDDNPCVSGTELASAYLTCARNEIGHEVKSYYDGFGRVDYIRDPNNQDTTYSYDKLSRLKEVKKPTDQGSPRLHYEYKFAKHHGGVGGGNYNDVATMQDLTSSLSVEAIGVADGMGKNIQSQAVKSPTEVIVQNTEYNEIAKVDTKYKPELILNNKGRYLEETNAFNRFFINIGLKNFPGDLENHNLFIRGAEGTVKSEIIYGDDPLARVWKLYPLGDDEHSDIVVTSVYSNDGANLHKITVVDTEDKMVESYSDRAGNVRRTVSDPGGVDEKEIFYDYNVKGQVTEVNDDGVISTNVYDTRGQVRSSCNPDSGCTTYTYNDRGNIYTITDGNNRIIKYYYDDLGRVDYVEVDENDWGFYKKLDYQYDSGCINGATNAKGRLCFVENYISALETPSSSVQYKYDSSGRVVQIKEIGNFPGQVSDETVTTYDYDYAGNIEQITEGGEGVIYTYNTLGQLETVFGIFVAGTVDANYLYNPSGMVKNITYGNEVFTQYGYDDRDWVKEIKMGTVSPDYTDLFYEQYDYDDSGNLVRIEDWNAGFEMPSHNGECVEFFYDNLYRLDHTLDRGQNCEGGINLWLDYYGLGDVDGVNLNYEYDDAGNRRARTVEGYTGFANDVTYTYDDPNVMGKDNRLMVTDGVNVEDDCVYEYDGVGNMKIKMCGDELTQYFYNHNNLITHIYLPGSGNWMYFVYDPLGRRIYKEYYSRNGNVHSKTKTFYRYGLGNNPLKEWSETYSTTVGGGGSCFIEGTKITLADGSEKNIEDVQVGDKILSYNSEKGRTESDVVVSLNRPVHDDMIVVRFGDSENTNTFDHPYFVKDKGWSSYAPKLTVMRYSKFVEELRNVEQLEKGDLIYTVTEGENLVESEIINIKEEIGKVQTYIFSVEKNGNFFANGALVHNKGPDIMATDGFGFPDDWPDGMAD